MGWVHSIPEAQIKLPGVAEVLGAIGLVAPIGDRSRAVHDARRRRVSGHADGRSRGDPQMRREPATTATILAVLTSVGNVPTTNFASASGGDPGEPEALYQLLTEHATDLRSLNDPDGRPILASRSPRPRPDAVREHPFRRFGDCSTLVGASTRWDHGRDHPAQTLRGSQERLHLALQATTASAC